MSVPFCSTSSPVEKVAKQCADRTQAQILAPPEQREMRADTKNGHRAQEWAEGCTGLHLPGHSLSSSRFRVSVNTDGTGRRRYWFSRRRRERDDGKTDEEGQVAKQNYEEKYTHPELREKVKEEIKASDKGGKEGQWSARKSQLLIQEYERRGGGYKGKKGQFQKDLEKWTKEEWQTQEGGSRARSGDETARYLPKEAWEKMSDEEKRETESKKREGSRQGQQHVANTEKAKQARKGSQALPLKDYDDLSVEDVEKKVKRLSKEEIREVRDYEKGHKNRKTLIESMNRKT